MIKSYLKTVSYWCIFCCFTSVSYAQTEALSVGWELWYPYQYHNNKQQLVGLDFDIFNAIVKQADLKVTYTELPWKRHLQYIKSGKMDVAMGASFTEERQQYAYFTQAYRTESVRLFVKKGNAQNIQLTSLAQLSTSNYMIGVEGGYYYGMDYQELIKTAAFQSHITEVIDLEQNVDLLMKGFIDGFLVDPITLTAFAEKYKLQDEFEAHSLAIYQDDIFIMLSKQSLDQAMLEKFNNAISTLKANGTIDKINRRWSKLLKDDKLL
ncbi:amino acid ABC transporter substrate-binding protein [Thalassotalea insulae]|uniref:Amino acid ABC transporter substrate-binding protein n=1 Tax=Thalassotalea insulae TaxID=2056778 RepID=A0ABQ6GWQ9_9GAMM|nr:transporter substrate-binding domain-containing protein [Thalassotalea insulae]GLX80355.1 amino acid ABC transporter substrate-binding protein [Thalassotalea insulae]